MWLKKRLAQAFLFFVLFTAQSLAAQSSNLTVQGRLTDPDNQPLAGATLMLLQAPDSLLAAYALSGTDGGFQLTAKKPGNYLLQVSYLGYQAHWQPLTLESPLDLGAIRMEPQPAQLETVEVQEDRIPVHIKKDTIEYDAKAFQTRPNADVEELLRQLPGVQVERDGTVRAQGEEVERVLVDGKEFFGKDPKIATKNLPADAVDKVQVFDRKSDMAEFSGIDDGQREKTLNLELKEDKKKGIFGNATAGAGPPDAYEGKLSLNRFTPQRQFSLLGMANNTNQAGFSFDDYLNFMGGIQSLARPGGGGMQIRLDGGDLGLPLNFGGATGLMTTWAGGLNYNQDFSEATDLRSNYFLNRVGQTLDRSRRRETYLDDRTLLSDEQTVQETRNLNHRLNLGFDHDIDSLQSLRFNGGLVYNTLDLDATAEEQNLSNGNPANAGVRENQNDGENLRTNMSLLYRRRFGRPGRTFSVQGDLDLTRDDQLGNLRAVNDFFGEDGLLLTSDTLRQERELDNRRRQYGARLSYTEPLGRRRYLELNYNFLNRNDRLEQNVYDLFNGEGTTRELNNLLSNSYDNTYRTHRSGLTLRFNRDQANWAVGLQAQYSELDGLLPRQDLTIRRDFLNWLPSLRYNYEPGFGRHLRLAYETFVQEPSLEQLQPVVDNRNPLDLYLGNPDLRPAYDHSLRLHYMSFDQVTMSSFMAFSTLNYTRNAISQSQVTDEDLIRTTRPVNVDYALNWRGNVSTGLLLRFIQSRLNLSGNVNYNRSFSRVQDADNRTDRWLLTAEWSLENRFKEKVDLSAGMRFTYNHTRYELSAVPTQSFLSPSSIARLGLQLPARFHLESDIEHTLYYGRSEGYNQPVTLWNAALSKFFGEEERLQLSFQVQNLLDQDLGIDRRTGFNYVEDERLRTLGRYFLLSVTYRLKGFGSTPGGGIRIMTQG